MVDTTRRRLLKYAASLAAALSAEDTDLDIDQLLEPDDEADVVTHSADNTSQHRNDERNTGYKERSNGKSPVEVNSVNELGTLTTGEFEGPPVTTPGGQYAIPGENILGLASTEGSLREIPANGETTSPIFHGETELFFGDVDGFKQIDAATGTQIDIIDDFTGAAGGAFAKYDGTGYGSRANATEEIDLESFDSDVLNNTNATAIGNFLILDEGQKAVRYEEGDLIRYDITSETEEERMDVDALPTGLSSDGDYIFGSSNGETLAYDAETLEKRGSAEKVGKAANSPTLVEDGDITEIYTEAKDEGKVYAEEFDKDSEEFTRKWEKDMGSFAAIDIVYEDAVIGSSRDQVFALNKETGEELWSFDQAGYVGTPYNDKIPVAGIDGTMYELDMNMEEIGSGEDECVPAREVTRGEESNGCRRSERQNFMDEIRDRYGTNRDDWPTLREIATEMIETYT
ncbi:MAG: hypothetical protein U5J64_07935 [Halobacteriales archaeon]|nr:hypothetical protein [Halobacteriales archaeon]